MNFVDEFLGLISKDCSRGS